jgi:hypothetical protein
MRYVLPIFLAFALLSGCAEPSEEKGYDTSAKTAAPALPSPDEPPSEITMTDFVAGQHMREEGGALSQTVVQIDNTKITSVIEWQIPQALQLYQAGHGKFPKDHETFMREIVEANNLTLPELKPGYEYWFNSETGQLMKRPAAQGK